jgi:hypothetical protein
MTDIPADIRELSIFLKSAVTSMAELQLRTIGHESELFAAGAFDQRLERIASRSAALFECIAEVVSQHASDAKSQIDSVIVRRFREMFIRLCDRMEQLVLPNVINHGDLNLANILRTSGGCRFIDWCEAYVGHPLSSLQHLLLLNNVGAPKLKASIDLLLKDKYRNVMEKACRPECLQRAFVYMPFLAAVSALYGRGAWFTTSQRYESNRQRFVQTIVRYLDRAARNPMLLDALANG